jgi:hypothetical protein
MAVIIPLSFFLITIPLTGQNGNSLNISRLNDFKTNRILNISNQQETYINNLYSSKVETPKEFLNGKEYETYYSRSRVKPLFLHEKKRTSTIITKTRRYNNLSLQYDTYLDEVIYTDTSRTINFQFPQIALNRDIVDGFILYFEDDSIIFKNFRGSEALSLNLNEGFYEVVYQGTSKYLIRHRSSEYVKEGRNNYKYSPENYIGTSGKFSSYKNRKNFLAIFGNKSEDVKRFTKTAGIKIRKADKYDLVSILKFYDSLLSSEK